MFDRRNEVARGQLDIVHLDGSGVLVSTKQLHHLPVASRPGHRVRADREFGKSCRLVHRDPLRAHDVGIDRPREAGAADRDQGGA